MTVALPLLSSATVASMFFAGATAADEGQQNQTYLERLAAASGAASVQSTLDFGLVLLDGCTLPQNTCERAKHVIDALRKYHGTSLEYFVSGELISAAALDMLDDVNQWECDADRKGFVYGPSFSTDTRRGVFKTVKSSDFEACYFKDLGVIE